MTHDTRSLEDTAKKYLLMSVVALLATLPWGTAPADDIKGDDLKKLANGRTWAISWQGNLSDPRITTYWDFRADGSVCARLVGSKKGDKCADVGKWNVQDDKICWQLTWLGEIQGYKSVCGQVRAGGQSRYELLKEKFQLAVFQPL